MNAQIFRKTLYSFLVFLMLLLIFPKGYFVLTSSSVVETLDVLPERGGYNGTIAYIINLDRSPERYKYVAPNVDLLGYEVVRISGVDGALLTESELHEKTDFASYKIFMGHYPKRGMIGCNLSHFKAWKTFLESDKEFAVIFEDDVSFNSEILKNTIETLKSNVGLWDVVTFEMSHSGAPLTLKHLDSTNNNLSVYLTEVTHAGCYLITRDAAKKTGAKVFPYKNAY